MARARIIHRPEDGDEIVCEIQVDASFPDAVAEAKAACVAMMRDLWAEMRAEAKADEEP